MLTPSVLSRLGQGPAMHLPAVLSSLQLPSWAQDPLSGFLLATRHGNHCIVFPALRYLTMFCYYYFVTVK